MCLFRGGRLNAESSNEYIIQQWCYMIIFCMFILVKTLIAWN